MDLNGLKIKTKGLQLGKSIKEIRIDELPQLFNVIIGEMSLIGPRPEGQRLIKCSLKK